jgi:hypothetical protein
MRDDFTLGALRCAGILGPHRRVSHRILPRDALSTCKIETNPRQLHRRMGCEGLVVASPYAVGNQRSVAGSGAN